MNRKLPLAGLLAAATLAFSASAAAETYSFDETDIVLDAWANPFDAGEEPAGFRLEGQDGFSLTAFGAYSYDWDNTTVVLGFTAAPGASYSIDWDNSWLNVKGTTSSLASFNPVAADAALATHPQGGNGLTPGAAWSFTVPDSNLLFGDGIIGGQIAYSVTSVPEPETYAMLLAGLGVIGAVARRRTRG
jgi:opacity protein-like surface antigen